MLRPTLTEIWGPPSAGKSHAAINGWPDPVVVDTAFTSLGFRDIEIDPDPEERGETWPVLLKINDYDVEAAEQQYHYLSEFPEDFAFAEDFGSVIIDNTVDLRVLAANAWTQKPGNSEWPQQGEWGEVNDMVDWVIRRLAHDHHVVVISQMKDEYVNGDSTGEKVREGPKRMEYKADIRIEMDVDENGHHAYVWKNRYMDPATDEFGSEGSDLGSGFTFSDIMHLSGVPEEQWRVR